MADFVRSGRSDAGEINAHYGVVNQIYNIAGIAGLDTNALDAVFTKVAITSPQRTAKIILNAVAKNKARVLPGADAKLFDFIVRLTGSGYLLLFVPMNRRLLPPTR